MRSPAGELEFTPWEFHHSKPFGRLVIRDYEPQPAREIIRTLPVFANPFATAFLTHPPLSNSDGWKDCSG